MKLKSTFMALVCVFAVPLSGCAGISTKREFADIQKQTHLKTQSSMEWNQNADAQIGEINKRLHERLSVDEVVQISLLNNPALQATFEDLGIAKTELNQSGLIKNPTLDASFRKPDHDGKINSEFEVRQDILDLLTLPLRKRVARQQLEQVKYGIVNAIISLDRQVKEAYYNFQAAKQSVILQQKILKAADAAADLADRQLKAGNISDLIVTGYQLVLYQSQMELAETEIEVSNARADLSLLMGIAEEDLWDIPESLPYLSNEEPSLADLEKKAMDQNIDLLIARQQVKALESGISLSRLNMVPQIEVGYNLERESDGGKFSGPVFGAEIPIFDQKQMSVARIQVEVRQSQKRLKVQENQIRAGVRKAYARLLNVRKNVESYKNTILPLQTRFTESLNKHYNFMLVGVYDLLDAKKEEIESYHKFIEKLKEYWIIRSELEGLIAEKIEYVPYVSKPVEAQTESKIDSKSASQPVQQQDHSGHGGKK